MADEQMPPRKGYGRRDSIALPPNLPSSAEPCMCDNLQCSICLDVFTDPVTTPCGHNFCKTCLKTCWEYSQDYRCPYCKETFIQRPDLKFNVVLKELVQLFAKSTKGLSSAGGPLSDELQCSICLDMFDNPVTTPCGHNFCDTCLKKFWDCSQDCTCPICKESFNKRPDLKSNTGLREIVQVFEKTSGYKRETIMIDYSPPMEREDLEETLVKPSVNAVFFQDTALSSSILTEDDVFNNPVTVPCVHNFCKTCLKEVCEFSEDFDCPCFKENLDENHYNGEFGSFWPETGWCLSSETKPRPHERVIMIDLVQNINHNKSQKHDSNLEVFYRERYDNIYQKRERNLKEETEKDDKTHNTLPVEKERADRKSQLVKSHTCEDHIMQDTMKKMKEHFVKQSNKNGEEEKAECIELFYGISEETPKPVSDHVFLSAG